MTALTLLCLACGKPLIPKLDGYKLSGRMARLMGAAKCGNCGAGYTIDVDEIESPTKAEYAVNKNT